MKGDHFIVSNDTSYYRLNCFNPYGRESSDPYLTNLNDTPIYLKKNAVIVDIFEYGDVFLDSYVQRKSQTNPNGTFVLNHWKNSLYAYNFEEDSCPIVPLWTYQCVV
eukprot:GHVR01119119.1.p1 GENE.GHVR01119119.1~~GHVR01119119.1.p1  ORF type:complete len:107 (-),score=11.70 GHVR01119119.1:119-439(-)